MIEISDLTFAYSAGHLVFDRFSWTVKAGEAWAVIGPSGCGKTTLLYLLAGLRQPTSGSIHIAGELLIRPRPTTGLILQDYGLLPWATVRENAGLGLRLREFYGPDGRHAPVHQVAGLMSEQVNFWLERLGIASLADKYMSQISGGQRQRAAIARTLVLRPDVLLMDEPFASLDAPTREDLQNLTLELQREQKLTTIVVTHNIEDAACLGERILVLAHPPHREPLVVENPSATQGVVPNGGYRTQAAFLEKCNELRRLLG
jgi:ABC-type nitrate/sulfonate/bicarbonate transport system ATPase subunit